MPLLLLLLLASLFPPKKEEEEEQEQESSYRRTRGCRSPPGACRPGCSSRGRCVRRCRSSGRGRGAARRRGRPSAAAEGAEAEGVPKSSMSAGAMMGGDTSPSSATAGCCSSRCSVDSSAATDARPQQPAMRRASGELGEPRRECACKKNATLFKKKRSESDYQNFARG